MKVVIEDNEFVSLWYHTDKKVVHHKIKTVKPPYNQTHRKLFRATLLRGVQLFKDHSANKWLSDDTDAIPIPAHDVEWGEKEWAPKAVVCGWRFWAMVVPKDLVSQMGASNIVRRLSALGVTVKPFSDETQALNWLESCGN